MNNDYETLTEQGNIIVNGEFTKVTLDNGTYIEGTLLRHAMRDGNGTVLLRRETEKGFSIVSLASVVMIEQDIEYSE